MATTFLEPGGDADFAVAQTNGFWGGLVSGAPSVVTDFVHGNHVKSIKPARPGFADAIRSSPSALGGTTGRASFWLYIKTLPAGTADFTRLINSGNAIVYSLRLTSAGVLQLFNNTPAQIGSNGSTFSTGTWNRISITWTTTSTTVNNTVVYVNGVSSITATNVSLSQITPDRWLFGNPNTDANLDFRISDEYADNSSSSSDPGNIWVTAKRPFSNGTTNGFTTQIGSGGSGYGTGHAPQVNERPLSTTNGWSMIGAGSAITEEYTIEDQGVGDITTVGGTIIDFLGWVSMSSLVGETLTMIVGGATFSQAITSTITLYTKVAGSTTYPTGNTDIGITTTTALTTVSLYECGVLVAFIPAATTTTTNKLSLLGAG